MNTNLNFITYKMWYPTDPNIKDEEDELFSFPHIAEMLDNIYKPPICAELVSLKSCSKNC